MKQLIRMGNEPDSLDVRDAIHFPVISVVAGHKLKPGDHVSLRDGKAYKDGDPIGIVDPFRKEKSIQSGSPIWVMIYQETIDFLWHEWTHEKIPAKVDDEKYTKAKIGKSRAWLMEYAARHSPYYSDAQTAYKKLMEHLDRGEIFYNGTDLHGLFELDDQEGLEFHASVVLGRPIRIDGDWSFSCSC